MRTSLTLLIGLLWACILPPDASACRAAMFYFRVMFDQIPFGLDAPVIARVTVTEASTDDLYKHINLVRVDEVLKGAIGSEYIKLAFHETTCGPSPLKVGATGIVLGTLYRDPDDVIGMAPVSDSDYTRKKRTADWGIP